MSTVVVGAEVDGCAGIDVRVEGGLVAEIGTALDCAGADEVVEANGGALIAGLHDHHIHLRATAAAATSVAVGPSDVRGADGLRAALRRAAGERPSGSWIRAVGYHESVAGDLDRDVLDAVECDHPVRVQHRTGVLWVLNSAALGELPLDDAPPGVVERDEAGRPTGRVWRGDDWLAARAPRHADAPQLAAGLEAVVRRSLQYGIVGFTDADPRRTREDVLQLRGGTRQRLHLMGPAELSFDEDDRCTLGPVKVLLDDHALPGLEALAGRIEEAHGVDRPVAVHCVTRTQLVLALAAFDVAGTTGHDRIEHGSIVPPDLDSELRRLGLTVVTQPSLVADRGDDYLRDVDADDRPHLYRIRSLVAAGVGVAFSSDAPYGDLDPWRTIAAAVRRRTPSGEVIGPEETVDPHQALAAFQGRADAPHVVRRVEVGAVADLCLLAAPLDAVLADPHRHAVSATLVNGDLVPIG